MSQGIKEFEINSLTEFIEIINSEKLDNYYFRGENAKYEKRLYSSLLREYDAFSKANVIYDYKKLIDEYYYEVANDLTEIEKRHFVAFSQHHSLKTNLIDFTTSPLIALYFACDTGNLGNISDKNNDIGYVYLINKNSTVDASNTISNYLNIDEHYKTDKYYNLSLYNEFYSNPSKLKNLLNYYFGGNPELYQIYNKNLLELCDVFNHLPYDFNIDYETIKYIKNYTREININDYITDDSLKMLLSELGERDINEPASQETIKKYVDKNKMMEDIIDRENNYRNEFIERWRLSGGGLIYVIDFVILFKLYLSDIDRYSYANDKHNFSFPQLPYLIYKTPYKFDRIKNQNGIFLYQGFYTYNCCDDYKKTMIQTIEPDITIKVNNKSKIFEALDLVGINRKFIYGDYDNTARYINDKYRDVAKW